VVDRDAAHSTLDNIFLRIHANMFESTTFEETYATMNTVRVDMHALIDKIYNDFTGDLDDAFNDAVWIALGTKQN